MMIRAYLRASTSEQDASRARDELKSFTADKGLRVAAYYQENVSGTVLDRPELNKLIDDSEPGDVLLVEKLDRLSRLPYEQWQTLKGRITERGVSIVVVDQSMTHTAFNSDDQSSFITKTLTNFMLDLAASMARDDYETRSKRQKQGISKARELGKYKGRPVNTVLHESIKAMLGNGVSWSAIQKTLKCSRSTIQRVNKQLKEAEQ